MATFADLARSEEAIKIQRRLFDYHAPDHEEYLSWVERNGKRATVSLAEAQKLDQLYRECATLKESCTDFENNTRARLMTAANPQSDSSDPRSRPTQVYEQARCSWWAANREKLMTKVTTIASNATTRAGVKDFIKATLDRIHSAISMGGGEADPYSVAIIYLITEAFRDPNVFNPAPVLMALQFLVDRTPNYEVFTSINWILSLSDAHIQQVYQGVMPPVPLDPMQVQYCEQLASAAFPIMPSHVEGAVALNRRLLGFSVNVPSANIAGGAPTALPPPFAHPLFGSSIRGGSAVSAFFSSILSDTQLREIVGAGARIPVSSDNTVDLSEVEAYVMAMRDAIFKLQRQVRILEARSSNTISNNNNSTGRGAQAGRGRGGRHMRGGATPADETVLAIALD